MNSSLLLTDVVLYSLQVGLLVAAAAAVPLLVRLRAPHARLAYWQLLLAACLFLPAIRPWSQEAITAPAAATFYTPYSVSYIPAAAVHHEFPWRDSILWLLAAGATLRLISLGIGLRQLRRYRLHSQPFETAYDADIRISSEVASPVTFGFHHPVILVPAHFRDLPPALQHGILCHEILHIERRDWLFTMAEEIVRAVFWFHPAIWWVLGEVQLAREQAVDRRVVELTAAREPYVDALLAMAGARPQLDLAPAPLFLRKRHLKHRVVEILKEANVSKKRLISALAAAVAIMAAVSWFVTGAIPLAASPQVVADAPGVSVNLNGARLMHRSAVAYPPEAAAKGTQGTVTVQVKLDGNGEVTDAAVLSGPEELRKPVLQSVLAWHFMKEIGGTTQTVSVEFSLPQQQAVPRAADLDPNRAIPRKAAGGSATHLITGIDVAGLSDQARDELLAQLPVHAGDTIGPDQMAALMRAVHNYDPHLIAGLTGSPTEARLRITAPGAGVAGGVIGGISGGVPGGVLGGIMGSGPAGPTAQRASVPGRIFVGGETEATKLVSQTPPEYPALAKQARISGTVELAAVIGKDGHVINLTVVRGHPLLVQAALEAVRNWVYQPTLLNGDPVEVATNITVNFTLAQ